MSVTNLVESLYPGLMKDIQKVLAENQIRIREERGLTQNALADKADLSIGAIQSIEYATRWPGIETIRQIAKVLKVPVSSLFLADQTEGNPPDLRQAFQVIERESEKLFKIPNDVTEMLLSIESEAHWEYVRVLLRGIENHSNHGHPAKDRKKS